MLLTHAKALVYEGFAIVPRAHHHIPTALIEDAIGSGQELIRALSQLTCKTSFTRIGEMEDDVFLIDRSLVPGKDIKYFLHFAHDLQHFIDMVPELRAAMQDPTLRVAEQRLAMLHKMLNRLSAYMLSEVQTLLASELAGNLRYLFELSCRNSLPYSTTTLRSLWYPAVRQHKGAAEHFDRSLLTLHLGDYGGSLRGHLAFGNDQTFSISPQTGEITMFWGIKALLASNGLLKPLSHSATAVPGQDRTALVQFNHVPLSTRVTDAKTAFLAFCAKSDIAEPEEWYRTRWSTTKMASR